MATRLAIITFCKSPVLSLPTVVVISEDPRTAHRANEALRIALGVVVGENRWRLRNRVKSGPALAGRLATS
ncbi:MAG: hypothetical protein ACREXY_07690 [Gammaproteobacteria bacterium]